jgi:hypothetical protein
MKIFSLESKTNLVIWGAVLSFVVNTVLFIMSSSTYAACSNWAQCSTTKIQAYRYGWPLKMDTNAFAPVFGKTLTYFINLFFWVVIVLLILGIIRHFKKKNNQLPSKQS